jgi:endonuclease III
MLPKMRMKPVDIDKVNTILKREFPKWQTPIIELIEAQTKDPFKVLVATLLSARTKDAMTATVTKKLFKTVHHQHDLEKLTIKQIEELIYPVGFYKTKAKHLKLMPSVLKEKFNDKTPNTIDELLELPGVGRKTANLVVATAFKKPAICVDTHVHRINNRLGYLKTNTPFETEMKLREILPKKYWITYNMYLVSLGQGICAPISPKCSICPLSGECNKVGVEKSR